MMSRDDWVRDLMKRPDDMKFSKILVLSETSNHTPNDRTIVIQGRRVGKNLYISNVQRLWDS